MNANTQYRGLMDQSKEVLKTYLNTNRDSLLFKLEGLSEHDARKPMTPTGTNILGLVKHVSYVTLGYLGDVFNRPSGVAYPTSDDPLLGDLVDLFASPDESIDDIIALHHLASKTANNTIDALDLNAIGFVSWWQAGKQEVSLEKILIHVIAETARHGGHADIVRELIDGHTGMRAEDPNIPGLTTEQWSDYVSHLNSIADTFST